MEWSSGDPREHFNKRGDIVIAMTDSVATGKVETKHSYYVSYSARVILPVNEIHPGGMIGPGDPWPAGWKWAPMPQ